MICASGVNSLVRQWWYQGQETLREPLGAGYSSIFAILNLREPALEGGTPTAQDPKGFRGLIGDSVIGYMERNNMTYVSWRLVTRWGVCETSAEKDGWVDPSSLYCGPVDSITIT